MTHKKTITPGRVVLAGVATGSWLWIARAGVTIWPLAGTRILPASPVTATAVLVAAIAAILVLAARLGAGNGRPRT